VPFPENIPKTLEETYEGPQSWKIHHKTNQQQMENISDYCCSPRIRRRVYCAIQKGIKEKRGKDNSITPAEISTT